MSLFVYAYVLLLILSSIGTFVYWFINLWTIDLSGPSPGITLMLFEDRDA